MMDDQAYSVAADELREPWHARLDRRRLREFGFSKDDIRLLAATAARFLESPAGGALRARVTQILTERDLTLVPSLEIESRKFILLHSVRVKNSQARFASIIIWLYYITRSPFREWTKDGKNWTIF